MHELGVLSVEGRKLKEVRGTDDSRVFVNSDVQGSADLRDNGHGRWSNSWWRLSVSLSRKAMGTTAYDRHRQS